MPTHNADANDKGSHVYGAPVAVATDNHTMLANPSSHKVEAEHGAIEQEHEHKSKQCTSDGPKEKDAIEVLGKIASAALKTASESGHHGEGSSSLAILLCLVKVRCMTTMSTRAARSLIRA